MVSVAFESALSGGPSANRGDVLAEALRLMESGYAVVGGFGAEYGICSCRKGIDCQSPAKAPFGGWGTRERKSLTESEARWMWGDERAAAAGGGLVTNNLFVVCYLSNIVVADVDNVEAWEASRAEGWEYPETLAVRTGSGGIHLYYHKQWDHNGRAPRLARSMLPGGAGDVRWLSVVVAPESMHVTGNRYEWLNDLEVAAAPDWLAQERVTATPIHPPDGVRGGVGAMGSCRNRWAIGVKGAWAADVAGFGDISSEYSGMARNRPGIGFAIACRAGWLIYWGILDQKAAVDRIMRAAAANGWPDAERQILNGIETGVLEAEAMSNE